MVNLKKEKRNNKNHEDKFVLIDFVLFEDKEKLKFSKLE